MQRRSQSKTFPHSPSFSGRPWRPFPHFLPASAAAEGAAPHEPASSSFGAKHCGSQRGELRAIRSNPASIIQALENYQHWHRCSCTVHISKATSLRTSIRYGNRLYDGVQTLLTPPVVGEIVAVWLHIHYGNQKKSR